MSYKNTTSSPATNTGALPINAGGALMRRALGAADGALELLLAQLIECQVHFYDGKLP
jgi:hypothetical protein